MLKKLRKLYKQAKKEKTLKSLRQIELHLSTSNVRDLSLIEKTEVAIYLDLITKLKDDMTPRIAS